MNSQYVISNNRIRNELNPQKRLVYKYIVLACFVLFISLSQFIEQLCRRILGVSIEAYVLMGIVAVLAFIFVAYNAETTKIRISAYQVSLFLFPIFCLVTARFASYPAQARMRSINQLELGVIFLLFSAAWDEEKEDIDSLLAVIMVANYIMVLYVLLTNGPSKIVRLLMSGRRIDSYSINANTLGMNCGYAILIHVYFLSKRRFVRLVPFLLLAAVFLLLSQSRKAIVIIVVGFISLALLFNLDPKKPAESVLRTLLKIGVLLIVFMLVSRTSVFSRFGDRMEALFSGLSGEAVSNTEGSFNVRMRMKEIGREIFANNPVIGIGLDNSPLICGPYFGYTYFYLHDNYIELLADTGAIGFALYYFIYALAFLRMLRYRRFGDKEYAVCLTLLIIHLILDYGCITYLDKYDGFLIFTVWFESEKLKRDYRRRIEEERARSQCGYIR